MAQEQPLPKHGACCLASLNLSEFVLNPYKTTATFDWDSFIEAIPIAVNALDALIDENYYRQPLQEQREMSWNYRNIGLGAFGYATALMKLGIRYGSTEAIELTDGLFDVLFVEAVKASSAAAKEKGSFPAYTKKVWDSEIIHRHFSDDEINKMKEYGLRNCSLISIAPNGSLATLLNESGGCEPEYAISYTRRTVGMTDGQDTYYDVYCKAAREYMEKYHTDILPYYFVGSSDIPFMDRIATQAVMQDHVDTAISSTINLPNGATKEDIADIYLESWRTGLKGVTIFRDGCKKAGILTTEKPKESLSSNPSALPRGAWKPKPADTLYHEVKLKTGCGKMVLMIGWSESEQAIQDIYVKKCSKGGCERLLESATIAMSAVFRLGGKTCNLEKAMEGIGTCNSFTAARKDGKPLSNGSSCGEAILRALREFEQKQSAHCSTEKNTVTGHPAPELSAEARCPECGQPIHHEGGCIVCSCGWSKCS